MIRSVLKGQQELSDLSISLISIREILRMTISTNDIPTPDDIYPSWRSPEGIDEFQSKLILSVFPDGSRIIQADAYRPGYLEYPLKVSVSDPDGARHVCVVKVGVHAGGVIREAFILPILSELELPVPSVLAGPVLHPQYPEAGELVILSEVPGKPLPFIRSSLQEADLTCRLLYEGVDRLHSLTAGVHASMIGDELPRLSLQDEVTAISERGGPWLEESLFQEGLDLVASNIPVIGVPLVFSNGDYNPLNFLHTDGRLSGFVDFSGACFEDPYLGFAKFVFWGSDEVGWGTGPKSGLVERYLYRHGITPHQFAPRLALGCLKVLQRGVSVTGEGDAEYRANIRNVLARTVRNTV